MAKKKTKRTNKSRSTIQEVHESRTGGQIALSGYSYQFLYSCYLILSELDYNTTFTLEGIEDIDKISCEKSESGAITHLQLKYSMNKQDASFLKDILKNFLEVYLIDNNREFKLIYDFEVAKGKLSNLIEKGINNTDNDYWNQVIQNIRDDNPVWNWESFSYDDFISKLSFNKV